MEAVFTVQFFFGDSLDHVQELLRDKAFEFAERLLLKNRTDLFFSVRYTLPEDQLSNFSKQRRGWVCQVSLEFFRPLEIRQLGKSFAWQLQKRRHLLVNICSVGRWRQFLAI